MDFSRAFDSIDRGLLLQRLHALGVPTNTIALLLSDTTVRVKLSGHLGEAWASNTGVVQGCGLSPLLFAAYLESTMRRLEGVWGPFSEQGRVAARDTLYADDTALHGNSRGQTESMVEAAEPIYRAYHLQLNVGKTHRVEAKAVPVKLQKGCRTTKHLGSLLGSAEDVANRIRQVEVVFGQIPWHQVLEQIPWHHRHQDPALQGACDERPDVQR